MIKVVPMEEKYIDEYRSVFDQVAREKKHLYFTEAPSLESTKKFVKSIIKNEDVQFVALDNGKVVGWVDIVQHKAQIQSHCGELGMGLLPAYRSIGIGKKLASAAIEKAHQKKLSRVELTVYASNKPAIALYEKLGFIHEGRQKKSVFLDGRFQDVLMMALLKDGGFDGNI